MSDLDLSDLGLTDKEEKILKSAVDVFADKGFSAATTHEIAKRAGVAEGTLFKYFKTKKGLLKGILIQLINLFSKRIILTSIERVIKESKQKTAQEVLKAIIYDRISLVNSIYPMTKVIMVEAILHDDIRETLYQNIYPKAAEIFTQFIDDFRKRGLIQHDIPGYVILRSIFGNIAGLIVHRKLFSHHFPLQELDREVEMIADLILHGISPYQRKG